MELISKGGYSEVFYDKQNEEVYRRSLKFYTGEKYLSIEPTSINDLIFTKSFQESGYTPLIHSIDTSGEYISFRMPYYGESLHDWICKNTRHVRIKYAAHILMQVVTACMYFDKNAFLHSDLKPSNIMIETLPKEDVRQLYVRIIDFNISTVRIVHDSLHWATAIGTWNYCAPEIILHETPDSNSISWTIGVITADIIDKFAFSDFVTEDMQHKLGSQENWKKIFNNLYINYPDHPPLSRSDYYPDLWKNLIWNCMHWCPTKRWNLPTIYRYLYSEILDDKERKLYHAPDILYHNIPVIEHMIYIGELDHEMRAYAINNIYAMCMRIKRMNFFPTAVAIFDRCESIINDKEVETDTKIQACSCILFSAYMFNTNILDSNSRKLLLMRLFTGINLDEVIEHMYVVGSHLHWKLWEKPVHIIIDDSHPKTKYNKIFWEHVKEGFLYFREYYTQRMVADYVMTRLEGK